MENMHEEIIVCDLAVDGESTGWNRRKPCPRAKGVDRRYQQLSPMNHLLAIQPEQPKKMGTLHQFSGSNGDVSQ